VLLKGNPLPQLFDYGVVNVKLEAVAAFQKIFGIGPVKGALLLGGRRLLPVTRPAGCC
jgi:hypothetical protein